MVTVTLLDHEDQPIGTVRVVGGQLALTGEAERFVRNLKVISTDSPTRQLQPSDGDAFLNALRWHFRNGYVNAVIMPEDAQKYDENQARDEAGRWTSEGGAAAVGQITMERRPAPIQHAGLVELPPRRPGEPAKQPERARTPSELPSTKPMEAGGFPDEQVEATNPQEFSRTDPGYTVPRQLGSESPWRPGAGAQPDITVGELHAVDPRLESYYTAARALAAVRPPSSSKEYGPWLGQVIATGHSLRYVDFDEAMSDEYYRRALKFLQVKELAVLAMLLQPDLQKYREDQARDDHGRFADEGASSGSSGPERHWSTGGIDTQHLYQQPDGSWKPERLAKVHSPMLNKMMAGVPKREVPTLYMTGGGFGSGKSTLLDKFPEVVGFPPIVPSDQQAEANRSGGSYQNGEAVRADPDAIKAGIPEYVERASSDPPDPAAATYAHEESSEIAKTAVREALHNGLDVVYDTSADTTPEKLAGKVAEFRQKATSSEPIRVVANYAFPGSIKEAQNRADYRAEHSGGLRRHVPRALLASNHHAVAETWMASAKNSVFDELNLWSTAGPFGSPPVKIASARNGVITVEPGQQTMFNRFERLSRSG